MGDEGPHSVAPNHRNVVKIPTVNDIRRDEAQKLVDKISRMSMAAICGIALVAIFAGSSIRQNATSGPLCIR